MQAITLAKDKEKALSGQIQKELRLLQRNKTKLYSIFWVYGRIQINFSGSRN